MRFTKFQGTGNDFIILNNMECHIPRERLGDAARHLCRRRLSIGADGLMAVEPPQEGGDFRMLFFNSDGSLGEMCGNGARCIARYGFENGLAGETQRIETTAGLVVGQRIDKRNYCIRLNDPTLVELDGTLTVGETAYRYSYLELGSPGLPHLAVELPGFSQMREDALRELGRSLRSHPQFPKGANVNFFQLTGQDELLEKTFERGVEDFTLACGTGTGCVAAALTLQGRVSGQNVVVNVPGGRLSVSVETEGDAVTGLFLTGPTTLVAEGEILDEDFPYSSR